MKKIFSALATLMLVMAITSTSFGQINTDVSLKIALTKQTKSYTTWIESYEDNVEFFNLYEMDLNTAMRLLSFCDGLIVTGGEDVFPGLYDQAADTLRCGTIDKFRDKLEYAAIDMAIKSKMPILGVCRGQQILNVFQGGSLYVDIPGDVGTMVVHRQEDWKNCFHTVSIVEETQLYKISGVKNGKVNSNHHQAINKLGSELKISAYSADKLPEAIEWEDRKDKGFLMAVQWHPERMDGQSPLSMSIAKKFLKEVELFKKK